MGMKNPVGTTVKFWNQDAEIIGMVEDFHFLSMYQAIKPLVLFLNPDDVNYGMVKLNSEDLKAGVENVQNTIKEIDPTYPLNYVFLDDAYNSQYQSEQSRLHILHFN